LRAAIRYATAHGGGPIGVASQSSAAAAILSTNADVAGLGGFSGRESSVTVSWLAAEVRAGHLRWVIADQTGNFGAAGDTRTGSTAAMSAVARTCRAVTVPTSADSASSTNLSASSITMYDCLGRAAALASAGAG
jgi:hypothetical protein